MLAFEFEPSRAEPISAGRPSQSLDCMQCAAAAAASANFVCERQTRASTASAAAAAAAAEYDKLHRRTSRT